MDPIDSDDSIIGGTPEKKKTRILKSKPKSTKPTTNITRDASCLLEALVKVHEKSFDVQQDNHQNSYENEEITIHPNDNENQRQYCGITTPLKNEMDTTRDESRLLEALVREFENNITQETLEETSVNKKSCDVQDNHHENENTAIHPNKTEHQKQYRGITTPLQTTFSRNTHNMYVFYLIKEVLKFSPNRFPKNSHIHMVGTLKYCDTSRSLILRSIEENGMQIRVDLKELKDKPPCDEDIILFGVFSFDRQSPVVVAKFFQKFTVEYPSYVKLMLSLRSSVPLENFKMISAVDKCDDSLGEVVSDEPECFLDGLTQKLNESLHLFQNDCISESVLQEFFNDVSFEKL